jgi:hypothetical protein
MTAMTIDTIKQTDLTVSERQVLDDDRERWQRMGSGAHLDDWLAYGPGLLIRRRLAMRIAYVNRPEGKGYARAFAQLMEHDGLDTMDKTSIGGALAARRAGALVGPVVVVGLKALDPEWPIREAIGGIAEVLDIRSIRRE